MSISTIDDGKFIEVNDSLLNILARSREEVVGKTSIELNIFQNAKHRDSFTRMLSEKGRVENFDIHIVNRAGQPKYGVLSADTIELDDKRYMLSVVNDITDRVLAQAEKEKLETQVQQAQKMESLGVLAGGIAHDFNNLLMAILGNADLALANLPAESPVRGSLTEIIDGSRRAAELCRQMLAYSGRSRFVVEPLDLTRVVREMSNMLSVAISKKAILRYNFNDHLPAVKGDVTQLRQVIMNLIINASDALTDKSGVIAVSTGLMECDSAYLNNGYFSEPLQPGSYVYVEVGDTGCGMTRDTMTRIFDPFFSTKQTGHGLGLSAVLGIIHGHKGAIRIESELGKGATFRVLLPASEASIAPASREPESANWTGEGTILIVDDEETVRILTKRMLGSSGVAILTASDGEEAIALFRQRARDIQCVILDLTMPRMDGVETLKELRAIRNDIAVILSSGYGETDIAERVGTQDPVGFIQKPFTRASLLAAIRRAVEGKGR